MSERYTIIKPNNRIKQELYALWVYFHKKLLYHILKEEEAFIWIKLKSVNLLRK